MLFNSAQEKLPRRFYSDKDVLNIVVKARRDILLISRARTVSSLFIQRLATSSCDESE